VNTVGDGNSSVGHSSNRSGVSNSGDRSGVSHNSVSSESTTSSKVISTGSSNSGLVSRDHGTVRVSNQMGVQVEGSGVSMVGDGSSVDSSNGSSVSNSGDRSGVSHNSVSSESTTSSKVISTGSSYSRLVSRDHGSIGMSNQVGVQVERSSITVMSNGSSVDSSDGSSVDSCDRSSVTVSSMGTMSGSQGSKMVSTGSSHGWLIHRDHSTIRMTHQAVEAGSSVIAGGGRSHNNTGRENLETGYIRVVIWGSLPNVYISLYRLGRRINEVLVSITFSNL